MSEYHVSHNSNGQPEVIRASGVDLDDKSEESRILLQEKVDRLQQLQPSTQQIEFPELHPGKKPGVLRNEDVAHLERASKALGLLEVKIPMNKSEMASHIPYPFEAKVGHPQWDEKLLFDAGQDFQIHLISPLMKEIKKMDREQSVTDLSDEQTQTLFDAHRGFFDHFWRQAKEKFHAESLDDLKQLLDAMKREEARLHGEGETQRNALWSKLEKHLTNEGRFAEFEAKQTARHNWADKSHGPEFH
jgi:hypothetical protein